MKAKLRAKPVKTVLIISSQTASSNIGAGASGYCLNALGIETVILPTTLFGRHPGWGAPGGGAIPAEHIASMWESIAAQDITFDGVLTGYMADPDQIQLAAKIINQLKALNPNLLTLVDPVMGDKGNLYVPSEVAEAIIKTLIPLADFITPNMWEFSLIANTAPKSAADIFITASAMTPSVIITSVKSSDGIGAMLVHDGHAYRVQHAKREHVPHGGGDALSGLALGHLINDLTPREAMARSVASIFEIFKNYETTTDRGELPLIRLTTHLTETAPLKLQKLKSTRLENKNTSL